MKNSGELRKDIYDYVREIAGRDVNHEEHKKLKTLLVALADNARENAPKVIEKKVLPVIKKIPIRRTFDVKGKCKYCDNRAGYGRIVCRECQFKKEQSNENKI
jgi:hypothetical protein